MRTPTTNPFLPPSYETTLWLLTTTLFCRSLCVTSSNSGSPEHGLKEPPATISTFDLVKPYPSNRARTSCHWTCKEGQCWNLCKDFLQTDVQSNRRLKHKRSAVAEDSGRLASSSASFSSSSSFAASSSSSFMTSSLSTATSVTNAVAATEDDLSGSDAPPSDRVVYGSSPDGSLLLLTATAHASPPPPPGKTRSRASSYIRNVSVTVRKDESNNQLIGDLRFWLSAPVEEASSEQTVTLHYASEECNVDRRYPECVQPNHQESDTITAITNTWISYEMTGLLFNARYFVELGQGFDDPVRRRFITPGCAETTVKDKIARCLYGFESYPTTEAPHLSLLVQVVCMVYDGDGDGGGGDDGGAVSVDIRWPVDRPNGGGGGGDDANWESSVWVQQLRSGVIMFVRNKIVRQEARFKLTVNSYYRVSVTATLKGSKSIVYHDLFLNTSEKLLKGREDQPGCQLPAAAVGRWILLGVLMVLSLSIVGIVFFVHRRFKGEGLAKFIRKIRGICGCGSLSEGQPLTPIDEWEIDPREVALGVEIGQGAFGRVLTGYYGETEVAIKIMKDNVPDLHRDDLLREISLMKGLGFHPNIVTILGACTLREPIALIVEYMPFGNLQSFLKKCRIDREMEVPEKRSEVTYCLLDEMTGVKESWRITSTDILSFARQVALAMQYLTERHYVHRDLAARNVLLGTGKVVKICDFGLARLVYTGDQYFKLTSGRLPLKWMAIESIRDRVFTSYSDVWSFGVLLWEMVTLGASPYPGVALVELYRLLAEGYRMQQPANCSDEIYDIISQCWCENPTDRPSFSGICSRLETLLVQNVDYLDLDNIDVCLEHSEKPEDSASNDRQPQSRAEICFY